MRFLVLSNPTRSCVIDVMLADAHVSCRSVPQYQHGVPSLNGASVWMRLEMASLIESALSDPSASADLEGAFSQCKRPLNATATAVSLRSEARKMMHAIRQTYVGGPAGGVWRSVQPNGEEVAVRTVMDFHTIGTLLGAPAATPAVPAGGQLTEQQRAEMASFCSRELLAADWIRALSLRDPNADLSSFRPDHDTIGSYSAWPAQALETLVTLSQPASALALLRAIAGGGALAEGPLGQARTLYTSKDGRHRDTPVRLCNASAAAFAELCVSRASTHWMMQGYNAAGAAFANAILRAVFAFQPPLPFGKYANLSEFALFQPEMRRGFDGSLRSVQWRGAAWEIESSATGVHIRPTRADQLPSSAAGAATPRSTGLPDAPLLDTTPVVVERDASRVVMHNDGL